MRRSKYGISLGDTAAEKALARAERTYGERVYASRAEARRAMELDALKAAGEIVNWTRAPTYVLIPKPNEIRYTPDFFVLERMDGERMVGWLEEVKGHETRDWMLRRKLFRHFYPQHELRVLKAR